MTRPLRIEYQGAHYHATSRGNERKAIFRGDPDRENFLELIRRAVDQFDLRLHAYVLMDNHYHLFAVGNVVQRVTEHATRTMARALKALEDSFKNQES